MHFVRQILNLTDFLPNLMIKFTIVNIIQQFKWRRSKTGHAIFSDLRGYVFRCGARRGLEHFRYEIRLFQQRIQKQFYDWPFNEIRNFMFRYSR